METSENSKEKKDGVDFNDRSCWEYLFKDYWFELKAKLSMNLDELTKVRTASVCGLDSGHQETSDDGQGASSDRSSACHDESTSKKKLKITRITTGCKISRNVQTEVMSPTEDTSSRKRIKNQSRNATPDSQRIEEKIEVLTVHEENSLMIKERKRSRKTGKVDGTVIVTGSELPVSKNNSRKKTKRRSTRTDDNLLDAANEEETTVSEYTDWASKELLEFVSHVRNGDKSILSPYEVQELLLDYIKVKKLRDRHKKSQIICDALLLTLFGKSRVAHFEMLKLLESHFLIKASSPASDEKQESDTDSIQMGAESSDSAEMMISEKRRIPRKRVEGKATNIYSYAAIDVHNISLMYLRRYLMEELIDDMSTFCEKVIGSFVRIRVSSSSQRQEVYRLVQVVGCGKAPEEYKTGKRTTDVMLEIINLDKKEVITVDIISNQGFTEEECKRLRQSIKFGFISRLTVGEVEEKARVLQIARVSEHLESEKLRLTHLRDRASEKGRKKEHRECVEKLHLLNNPEEHVRWLDDVAQAHADPKMDPSYESPEDDGDENGIKEGNTDRTKQSTFKEKELISPQKGGSSNWSTVPKISNNIIASPKKEEQISNVETQKMEAEVEVLSEKKEPASESTVLPELKLEESSVKVVSQPNASENEKLWQYKDPSGKIQGPFSIVQLRKWSKHFPSNLVIWKKSERQEDSILLTDALSGNFKNDLPEWVPTNSLHSISQSPPIISSSKVQETYSVQNDKADGSATHIESVSNLDNKNGTESNDFHKISRRGQVSAQGVSDESNHPEPYQLNRPPVVSSELDPRKKFLEEPASSLGNGNNTQKQDLDDSLMSDRCSVLGVKALADKVVDHSTSSTESNTVPEASQCDHILTRFKRGGESHTKPFIEPNGFSRGGESQKPIIEPNALESISPQRSDSCTFTKTGPETQSAYANTLIQIPATFVNSASVQPSHLVPQVAGPCSWNQLTHTVVREQPLPAVNSTTMHSNATADVSTSLNCQIAPFVSSNGSIPFPSPQLNNNTSAVTYQPANMSWGTGNTEAVNAPGWQVQTQYQNLSNIAAAVGNLLCGTGVQGAVNPNQGWGMMAQGNMNMPWVVPPNVNLAWNQGLTLPPQGNPLPNFVRPSPAQGNVAPHPIWSGPVQPNSNQIPSWPAALVPNSNQIPHQNNIVPQDSSKDAQSSSGVQGSRDGNFGVMDGGFRGAGSGYGSGRQSRNWMGSGGAERPPRPHQEYVGICLFHRSGHCKKGTSCNFLHQS